MALMDSTNLCEPCSGMRDVKALKQLHADVASISAAAALCCQDGWLHRLDENSYHRSFDMCNMMYAGRRGQSSSSHLWLKVMLHKKGRGCTTEDI